VSPPPPPLSIVVPSRNTKALTLACLASLAAAVRDRPQLAGTEVVLVDDAGADGTAGTVAARCPQVRLLRLERQGGFTRAANRGLAAAAGELLVLLNSDTEVAAEGLAALPGRFAAEPGLGIAGAELRYPDGIAQWSGGGEPGAAWLFGLASGLPEMLARLPHYRRLKPAAGTGGGGRGRDRGAAAESGARPRPVAWVTGAAMAIRRRTWEQVGPLDERFDFYAQDLDLCLRARDLGWQVAVLPEFQVVHHHGATIAAEGGRRPRGAGRGGRHTELLWTDLLLWAAKRGGAPAARRAARALAAGGALRLVVRRLLAPLLPAAERHDFRAETAALARALAAVRAAAAAAATARGADGGG